MSERPRRPAPTVFSPPFIISVLILGITAVALPWANREMKVVLSKEPAPLRRPLTTLDKSRLGSYVFRSKVDLEAPVEDALGANEYIFWILEDTEYPDDSPDPRRVASLAVTYYTGQPDAVPHTPDACLVGAGYTIEHADYQTLAVPTLPGSPEVPVRVITSIRSGIFDRDEMTVVYTFYCNGQFAAARNNVRRIISDPRDRHAYYSKVEVTFGWENALPRYPARQDAVQATEKLLRHVLPLLVAEHWPDMAKLEEPGVGYHADDVLSEPRP